MTAGTICQNRWIDYFTTGATLPRVKSTNKVIILFCIHTGFALRASHGITSYFISSKESLRFKMYLEVLHKTCQLKKIRPTKEHPFGYK